MKVDANTPLGTLVTTFPASSKVLQRHGLDFCCGGRQTLAAACQKAELNLEQVLSDFERLTTTDDEVRWDQAPIAHLVDHILTVYHAPLPEDLAQLEVMSSKVLRVHGDKDPERLQLLASTIHRLGAELVNHMRKEEHILFPWILSGRSPKPEGPIAMMLYEHESAGSDLETIVSLTDDFLPPEGACATWRTLYARLRDFDTSLRKHIHLENNILFPRALVDSAEG